jgi:hypothetical protein
VRCRSQIVVRKKRASLDEDALSITAMCDYFPSSAIFFISESKICWNFCLS